MKFFTFIILFSFFIYGNLFAFSEEDIIKNLRENCPWIQDDSNIEVKIEYKITDNINKPFIDDPNVLGKWIAVDFIRNIDDYNPNVRSWDYELYFSEISFLENGKTQKSWWAWTKNYLIHHGDETASEYTIKTIDDKKYLFIQWKSGDYSLRAKKPSYYVFEKNKD